MQAIILAGGKGTRLRAMNLDCPKVLVPVCGKPFIEWQVAWLMKHGVQDIHLAGGHQGDALRDWIQSSCLEANMTFSKEPLPLGTAGGLKFVESFVRSDPFLVLNGDSLLPGLSLRDLEDAHLTSHAMITIAVTEIEESGRYGTVKFDGQGLITAFLEKAERSAGHVNGGVYAVSRSVLAMIKPETELSLETDVFPLLARNNQLHAFPSAPPLLDMGTPEGIEVMTAYLENNQSSISNT